MIKQKFILLLIVNLFFSLPVFAQRIEISKQFIEDCKQQYPFRTPPSFKKN